MGPQESQARMGQTCWTSTNPGKLKEFEFVLFFNTLFQLLPESRQILASVFL